MRHLLASGMLRSLLAGSSAYHDVPRAVARLHLRLIHFAALLVVLASVPGRSAAGISDDPPSTKLTLRVTRITLRVFCAKLTEASSVTHRPSAEVADLHVSLSVRDLPLAVLRGRVAEVMNLTWEERGGDGPACQGGRSSPVHAEPAR